MPNKEPKEQRIFARGTRIEICPFRRGHSHHYLAHLDGKRGTVEGVAKGHGEHLEVLVLLEDTISAVSYPVNALRPIPKEK